MDKRYVLEDEPPQARYVIEDDAPKSTGLDFSLNTDKVAAVGQGIKDAGGALVRSGTGIVSNLMRPFEAMIPGGEDGSSGHSARTGRVDSRLRAKGYNPDSATSQLVKLGGDIMLTAPVGGALGSVAGKLPALQTALRTGGFRTGLPAAPLLSRAGAGQMALRTGAGAAVGGASTALVDPEHAGVGAIIGGALPGGVKLAGEAGQMVSDKVLLPAARRLMQSAIKPTIKQLKTGDARVAIDTLLDYGINPNQRGVEKLRGKIDELNADIAGRIGGSNATVNRADVADYLNDVRAKFGNQVSPTSDLSAINSVGDDFMSHPSLTGNNIPVQMAQKLKVGTYKALSGKYGEAGSAATEAQKALARGLKDKIADVVPGIGKMNAEEARLIKTIGVAERRALMELNKNPVGLSVLASNPIGFAAFMADKSAAFKSIAARMVNNAAKAPGYMDPAISGLLARPAVRSGLLAVQQDQ